MKLQTQIAQELNMAEESRQAGNEGRARVCARRAAGLAAGAYLKRNGQPNPGPSAYDRLQILASTPGVAPQFQEIAQHLILRVNDEFKLPAKIDLIAEARQLIAYLLPDEHEGA